MSAAVVLTAALFVALAWVPVRPHPVRAGLPVRWARRPVWWRAVQRRRGAPDLAVVVTEVASRLRTGAPPATAWALTVERALGPATADSGRPERALGPAAVGGGRAERDDRGPRTAGAGPAARAARAAAYRSAAAGRPDGVDGVPAPLTRLVQHCVTDPATASAARTVLAASRLTHDLGAPLAEVLDRCAATVTEAEQARDARRVALAGPRSTARILAGLPPLGLVLGAGLGADPVAAATDGGWGTASVVTGLMLLLVGRRWTRALVAAAERPTTARRSRRWETR